MPNRQWKIESLAVKEINGTQNVVVRAAWSLVTTEGEKSFGSGGAAEFDYDGEGFVPFDQLTEEQVIGWVQAQYDLPKMYSDIDAAMAVEPTPDVIPVPLPWND